MPYTNRLAVFLTTSAAMAAAITASAPDRWLGFVVGVMVGVWYGKTIVDVLWGE